MRESTPPSLEATRFFEVESAIAGTTYGVWVTTPAGYESSGDRRYPAIFMPDGNIFAPATIPFMAALGADFHHPIAPFIQVTIGYVGAEVKDFQTVRNRDLLPAGEPPSPRLLAQLDAMIAAGTMTPAAVTDFKERMLSGRAEAFLQFLTDELYPQIAQRWRLDPAATGLWGDSYGGLFSSWAAMQRHALFRRIGAGSPGILTLQSKVFERLEAELASGADHVGRHLHLSLCQEELTAPTLYRDLARSYAHLLAKLEATPLPGLKVTTHIVPYESHLTGALSNWFSFLRACYPA